MKLNFLEKVDNSVIFNGNLLEIYIPSEFFTINIAEFEGEMIKTIGIFNFIYYPNERKIKQGEMHIMKLPMKIKFEFDNFRKEKTIIGNAVEETEYYIFDLINGNLFIDNLEKEQSANNSKDFIYLLHSGHLPQALKYEDIIKLYIESITLNKVKLNNMSVIFEMTIAELQRSLKNIEIPFRILIGKNGSTVSSYDYQNISLKSLPSINSTFNAMTFENINQAIISSIKKTRNNEKENKSPVEEIIKY